MLGLFRGLLVVVSIVIIALIVYVLTIEKIKSIATLKLIGAPNRVIVRLIMEQSLALTLWQPSPSPTCCARRSCRGSRGRCTSSPPRRRRRSR